MSWFKRKEPLQGSRRSEVLRGLTDGLVEGQLNTVSSGLDAGILTLAPNQTKARALAEWHAVLISGTLYGLWCSLRSQSKISPFLELFRAEFLRQLDPECRTEFVKIANDREDEYVPAIKNAIESPPSGDLLFDMLQLTSLMCRRITGDVDDAELIGANVFQAHFLESVLVTQLTSVKKLFDDIQLKYPETFSGPLS